VRGRSAVSRTVQYLPPGRVLPPPADSEKIDNGIFGTGCKSRPAVKVRESRPPAVNAGDGTDAVEFRNRQ